jgi:hypothetical protein
MLRRLAFTPTDVSEVCIVSIIRVTRIVQLGTTHSVPSQSASVASYC